MSFNWGTVTGVSPLRVRLDGDTSAVPVTPDSLVDPLTLAINDRVRVELSNNRLVVLGKAGGVVSAAQNLIINGNFRTNQRAYVSAASLALGAYGFDRWKAAVAATTLTFTASIHGQPVTINSGKGIQQIIERANVPQGEYTLAWEGTATARVYNVGATPPAYAASPITVTLDGAANVVVEFTASGGAKTVGKVQMVAGANPSVFVNPKLVDEIRYCQRYFWRLLPNDIGYVACVQLSQYSNTDAYGILRYPVQMRILPALSFPSGSGYYTMYMAGNTYSTNDLTSNTTSSKDFAEIRFRNGSSMGTTGRSGWMRISDVAAYLDFDAEL